MNVKELESALPSIPSSSNNNTYTFQSPRNQCFTFPKYMMDYAIESRRSSKAWNKLIKTCKYFFNKKQVVPLDDLNYDRDTLKWKVKRSTCWMKKFDFLDLNKIGYKLWLCNELKLDTQENLIPIIKSKVYEFNLKKIELHKQNITFDEFQLFTSKGKITHFHFFEVSVKYDDDSMVPFDVIIGKFPLLEWFKFETDADFLYFKPESTKNLVEILLRYSKLRYLFILGISEDFDFSAFAEFAKTNKTIYICLEFFKSIPENYKEQIRNFWRLTRWFKYPLIQYRYDANAIDDYYNYDYNYDNQNDDNNDYDDNDDYFDDY